MNVVLAPPGKDRRASLDPLDFSLPAALEATRPPEARGLSRDGVRLMVSYTDSDRIVHARFRDLERYLDPGDLVVINTSGTRPAAVPAVRIRDGLSLIVHLSTHQGRDRWAVELRLPAGAATEPFRSAEAGERLRLPDGGEILLRRPYGAVGREGVRLWEADVRLPGGDIDGYLARHGAPIHYAYVPEAWPLDYYQTVYATEPGSAEMPSAGRAFTAEGITRLVARGVQVAPLILHTGVASLEDHEPPYAEYFNVPEATARAVNSARAAGNRVIAVGTTVVRALESVVGPAGDVHAGGGWTDRIITSEQGVRVVDGLLTGFHEPRASHLAMLEAVAGRAHLAHTYRAALDAGYLWHEFGDLHLLLAR